MIQIGLHLESGSDRTGTDCFITLSHVFFTTLNIYDYINISNYIIQPL